MGPVRGLRLKTLDPLCRPLHLGRGRSGSGRLFPANAVLLVLICNLGPWTMRTAALHKCHDAELLEDGYDWCVLHLTSPAQSMPEHEILEVRLAHAGTIGSFGVAHEGEDALV